MLLRILLLFVLLLPVAVVTGADDKDLADLGAEIDAKVDFTAVPPDVETAMTRVLDYMNAPRGTLTLGDLRPLLRFMRSAAATERPWLPADRWKASGAGAVTVLPGPYTKFLDLYYSTNVPDYAIFSSALRYSTNLDPEHFTRVTRSCVLRDIPLNSFAYGKFVCIEETTPNQQSGTAYHYTNERIFVHANVAGTPVFISFANMIGRSSFGLRGLPVGPAEHHLYYYSKLSGTNLRGLNWVKPIMYVSKTLVMHMPLSSNTTAALGFSWVSAGWKGLNVTRSHHIYPVILTAHERKATLARDPRVTYTSLSALTQQADSLSPAQINARYAAYCTYVKQWRDKVPRSLTSFYGPTSLRDLYDEKALAEMSLPHRRALILQESVRRLLGRPTWSELLPSAASGSAP